MSSTIVPEQDPESNCTIACSSKADLQCDYLVVGAGTAGMSFVDTILTRNPSATIILVDRNAQPGGHWTHAYPFARLQHPSYYYGVNSLKLAKSRNCRGKEKYDITDRATASEIVDYYAQALENFHASGRVRSFFGAEYKLDEETGMHTIVVSPNGVVQQESAAQSSRHQNHLGHMVLSVKCGKLVTVATNVNVPSMREPFIPVDKSVNFVPVNAVPSSVKEGNHHYQNYIVFGAGKTGVDAIVQLLDSGVDSSQITWVVSRDVWYLLREAFTDFYGIYDLLGTEMLAANSVQEYFLNCEQKQFFGRRDPNGPFPQVFKGATIDTRELKAIQSIQNVVLLGRATSIEANRVVLERGSFDFVGQTTLLVDCMAQDFYGYASFDDKFTIFEPGRINLGPVVMFFNPSYSSAHIAFLESAFDDDASKNNCCCYVRGKYGKAAPELIIGQMYVQLKTIDFLVRVPGGARFILGSRTNIAAPFHHKGGFLRFVWFLLGPQQGYRFAQNLMKKVESKGYSDLDHCFGVETFGFPEPKSLVPYVVAVVILVLLALVGIAALIVHA